MRTTSAVLLAVTALLAVSLVAVAGCGTTPATSVPAKKNTQPATGKPTVLLFSQPG